MKKILILALVCNVFFASCFFSKTVDEKQNTRTSTGTQASESKNVSSNGSGKTVEPCSMFEGEKKDVCLDSIKLDKMRFGGDFGDCASLKSEKMKKECDSISDSKISEEAKRSKNSSICDKVKNQAIKDDCKKGILAIEASQKQDVSLCDKLPSEKEKTECKNNILFSKAMISGDEKECKNLKEGQDDCIYSIKTREAIQKKDYKLCEKITNSEKIEDCKVEIATSEILSGGDTSACKNISSEEKRKTCEEISKAFKK